jgi:hypothetical protein
VLSGATGGFFTPQPQKLREMRKRTERMAGSFCFKGRFSDDSVFISKNGPEI